MNGTKTRRAAGSIETNCLSATDLFKGLPASCLRKLKQESEVLDVHAGHIFFGPGERGQVLYVLEEGSVRTFRRSGGKKLIIADLEPPAVFGEMGCVGRCTYHCYAQTNEPARVRAISRARLEPLLQQFPSVTRKLLDLVSERFVHVLLDLEATSFRHLIPRLANLLIERAEGDWIRGITHKEIAEHLRVHRESATSALGELRKAGIIAVQRKQIRIIHRDRLQRAAQE